MNVIHPLRGVMAALPRSMVLSAADAADIKDFTRDLEQAVREIGKAVAQSASVKTKAGKLMADLEGRGWWGQMTSGLSGSTDKELATLVEGLGSSLEVTQKVVQVMLKVTTQKSQVLRGFNDALVDKIAKITEDTRTLDGNQKGVVKAFLGQLQKQVFEQIQQQEMVDSHELRLIDHEEWRADKDIHDHAVNTQLVELDVTQQASGLDIRLLKADAQATGEHINKLTLQQSTAGSSIAELERRSQKAGERLDVIDQLNQMLAGRADAGDDQAARLAEQNQRLVERVNVAEAWLKNNHGELGELRQLTADQSATILTLQQRLSVIEHQQSASRRVTARIARQAPAILALLGAAAGLYFSLAH